MPTRFLRFLTIALLTFPALVHAQAKVGDRFGDWVFECIAVAEGRTACALAHTSVAKDNRGFLRLSLARNEQKKGVVLTAILPLGIHLPSGVSGSLDQGKPFAFTLETCVAQPGCIATYAVDAAFLKALAGGKQLGIGFMAAGAPKPIVVAVPLAGIADGLKAARLD
jgi:invasion protein IalB